MNKKIVIQDVSISFKGETVLNNVNLDISNGDIIGLTGENGSGKSVLFKMICGLITPNKGKIIVSNQVISNGKFPDNIGILLDGSGFLQNITGFENLDGIARISNKIDKTRIHQVMRLVGLDPTSKKKVKKYSLGMKQRLGIAMAIMEEPDLLLLDEPMNSLDKEAVLKTRELIKSLNEQKGVTVLLTSHNEEDISSMCHTVYTISDKKIIKLI
jgi:ABC-2 type transport system ATP-binding protein